MPTQQSIILAAEPGLLRNALQNLLSTFASVDTLVLTSDLPRLSTNDAESYRNLVGRTD